MKVRGREDVRTGGCRRCTEAFRTTRLARPPDASKHWTTTLITFHIARRLQRSVPLLMTHTGRFLPKFGSSVPACSATSIHPSIVQILSSSCSRHTKYHDHTCPVPSKRHASQSCQAARACPVLERAIAATSRFYKYFTAQCLRSPQSFTSTLAIFEK